MKAVSIPNSASSSRNWAEDSRSWELCRPDASECQRVGQKHADPDPDDVVPDDALRGISLVDNKVGKNESVLHERQ